MARTRGPPLFYIENIEYCHRHYIGVAGQQHPMASQPLITLIAVGLATLLVAGCVAPTGDPEIFGTATGGTLEPGKIIQAGSSTVFPLAEVWAEQFGTVRGVAITVDGGGSGAGASGICHREIDLGDMSREMKPSEIEGDCAENGVNPIQWKVAFDGISVVVSRDNTFVQNLSVDELEHIFRGEDPATTWNQVDPEYPNNPIRLCYPDNDSGTYEYFGEVILHEADPRRGDGVQVNPDDNVLVRCLKSDPNAIGYFGFAYLQENTDSLRAVQVNGVAPTVETIADGSYAPLSRPIYIYTDGIPTGILADYMHYVLHPEGGQRLVEPVGYVPLDENTRLDMVEQLGR